MKSVIIALAFVSGIANAQTSTSQSSANANQTQGLIGSGNSSMNFQTTSYAPYIPVSSAFAAPLTSGLDTCMGSSSGGAAGPGFSLSIGSTWSDKNCLMLKNAREMWNMGFKDAAFARMCMDPDNREAIRLTGGTCPQDKEPK
jgi:hypothetical protein